MIAYPLSTRFITSGAKTRFQDKYYLKTKLKFLWELRFVVSEVRKSVSKKGRFFLTNLKKNEQKVNYIPKNGLYIKLHQITCNFF